MITRRFNLPVRYEKTWYEVRGGPKDMDWGMDGNVEMLITKEFRSIDDAIRFMDMLEEQGMEAALYKHTETMTEMSEW